MPEYILKFNIPEEQEEFENAVRGSDLASIIHELQEWLRGEIKYNNKEEYIAVRSKLNELLFFEPII